LTRIVVLAPEPIRPRMAGMGIRALELARALQREFDVRLLVPNDEAEVGAVAADVTVVRVAQEQLARAASGADAAVVSGHAANWWFHQVPGLPVAVDLYDPFFVENLHYVTALGAQTAAHDHATLDLALCRGDFFLCASPEQRLFYAGALFSRGRIGPRNFPTDPTLAGLVATVPFGVPAEASAGNRERGRQALGVDAAGPVLLFGGIYDWYEPDLLLEAWPGIVRRHPDARVLFSENPNPKSTPQRAYARARERAREIDPQGRTILFAPWLPYAARADLYAACDLLVSICSPGLETDLSFRTRLLDAAWGGLGSLSVGGGSLARQLEAAGAARTAPASASALAEAVSFFLADGAARERTADAARLFASARTWPTVAAPLAAWLRDARVDRGRLPFPHAVPLRTLWQRLAGKRRARAVTGEGQRR
jgi:glycosyltransferase involved in cell wall biosynthesis